MRYDEQVLNMSEIYWDASRANVLLEYYERLEAAAYDVCELFPTAQPFGNLAAALERLAAAKEIMREGLSCAI